MCSFQHGNSIRSCVVPQQDVHLVVKKLLAWSTPHPLMGWGAGLQLTCDG